MKRRRFVWLSMAGPALLGLPSIHCGRSDAELKKVLSRPEVLSRFCDAETIRKIGAAYRQRQGEENSETRLQDTLLKSGSANQPSAPSDSVLRSALRTAATEDFRAGRIIKIHGWIVSHTEARQCALFSFI